MFSHKSSTTKCKTQLKLAVSRIKILRNTKQTRVKYMRKDIAQLLENKQDVNARSKAELAIRDQNMVDAYDVIEGYCGFLSARIEGLRGRNECPPELKEAIASLIYAGPRVADLPELLELRSIFSSKFGKQFIATILELRTGCGVSPKITEKLSIQPPSVKVRINYMKDVAKEFNIKWQPTDLVVESETRPSSVPRQSPATPMETNPVRATSGPPVSASPNPSTARPSPSSVQPLNTKAKQSENASPNSPLPKSPGYVDESEDEEPTPKVKNQHPKEARKDSQESTNAAKQQFIPFVSQNNNHTPDPYAAYTRGIVNPYIQQHSPLQKMPSEMSPRPDPYAEFQNKNMRPRHSHSYIDVASAAEAAAESADQAAVAARAAANLANKQFSRESSMNKISPRNSKDIPSDDFTDAYLHSKLEELKRFNSDGDVRESKRVHGAVNLKDRVSLYMEAHANDTDSEFEVSPMPSQEHKLNRNVIKKEEVNPVYDEISDTKHAQAIHHWDDEDKRRVMSKPVYDQVKPVYDEVKPVSKPVYDHVNPVYDEVKPVSKPVYDHVNPVYDEAKPVYDEVKRVKPIKKEVKPVYDDTDTDTDGGDKVKEFKKVYDKPDLYRQDSLTLNLEKLNDNVLLRTEKLFEKEDEETRRLSSKQADKQRLSSKFSRFNEERLSSKHDDKLETGKRWDEGRGSEGKIWEPPTRSPPKVPEKRENSNLDVHKVPYGRRIAAASVRTKRT